MSDNEFFLSDAERANHDLEATKPLFRKIEYISEEMFGALTRKSVSETWKMVYEALLYSSDTLCSN